LGEESEAPGFLSDTGAEFPFLCVQPETFFAFIGKRPPRVCLIQQGQVRAFWDDESFDPKLVRTWWPRN